MIPKVILLAATAWCLTSCTPSSAERILVSDVPREGYGDALEGIQGGMKTIGVVEVLEDAGRLPPTCHGFRDVKSPTSLGESWHVVVCHDDGRKQVSVSLIQARASGLSEGARQRMDQLLLVLAAMYPGAVLGGRKPGG